MEDAPLRKHKMLVASKADSAGSLHYETYSRPTGAVLFNDDARKTMKFSITDEGYLTDIMYYVNNEWQIAKP